MTRVIENVTFLLLAWQRSSSERELETGLSCNSHRVTVGYSRHSGDVVLLINCLKVNATGVQMYLCSPTEGSLYSDSRYV